MARVLGFQGFRVAVSFEQVRSRVRVRKKKQENSSAYRDGFICFVGVSPE